MFIKPNNHLNYYLFPLSDPSPAVIEQLDSPQTVNEGQNAKFQCHVSGSPRPNVTWLKGKKTIAVCDGKQNGTCSTKYGSKYQVDWKHDRACMGEPSSGPMSGGWVSWLNVIKTQSPADFVKYTCLVDNGNGQQTEQVVSLAING